MKFEKHIINFANNLKEGVMAINTQKNIILINRSAIKILGLKIDPKEKNNITLLLGAENKQLNKFIIESLKTHKNRINHELTYNKKFKKIKLQLTTSVFRKPNDRKAYCIFIIINDITNLWNLHKKEKTLLTQLRKNYINQMENLRQISNSVAHEVKNPLVSIGGYANLLLKKCDLLGTEDQMKEYKKYLTYIKEDTERLYKIIAQVEMYSDLYGVNYKKNNIVKILNELFRFADKFAKSNSIEIEIPELDAKEYFIYSDSSKIKLALYNIIKHSILLSIKEKPVLLHLTLAPYELRFSVDIHGKISREEVPFLFNPFYTMQNQELNFDLAVAQRILMLHGGIINLQWKSKDMVSFNVSIPKEKRLSKE